MFSPWAYNTDAAARRLLEAEGWRAPEAGGLPSGGELVEFYLRPLAGLAAIAPHVRYGARVSAIGRLGLAPDIPDRLVAAAGRHRRHTETAAEAVRAVAAELGLDDGAALQLAAFATDIEERGRTGGDANADELAEAPAL
jgi:hypothetical protein